MTSIWSQLMIHTQHDEHKKFAEVFLEYLRTRPRPICIDRLYGEIYDIIERKLIKEAQAGKSDFFKAMFGVETEIIVEGINELWQYDYLTAYVKAGHHIGIEPVTPAYDVEENANVIRVHDVETSLYDHENCDSITVAAIKADNFEAAYRLIQGEAHPEDVLGFLVDEDPAVVQRVLAFDVISADVKAQWNELVEDMALSSEKKAALMSQ